MNWNDQLPAPLLPFLDRFLATEKPYVRLEISKDPPAQAWLSAIGQLPYWPLEKAWPTDENGRPLFGLLQLNLAELPALSGFPTHGILQFFITDNAFWGANPVQPQQQDNYRVVYHDDPKPEEVDLLQDFSFLPHFEDLPLQRNVCLAVRGELATMLLPPDDYRFDDELGDIFHDLGEEKWEVLSNYRKAIGTVGHRMGGYAAFVQEDPRKEEDEQQWELLLQLDTDPGIGLLWGDYGVAHWFYEPPIAQRSVSAAPPFKFDKTWYGWESN